MSIPPLDSGALKKNKETFEMTAALQEYNRTLTSV